MYIYNVLMTNKKALNIVMYFSLQYLHYHVSAGNQGIFMLMSLVKEYNRSSMCHYHSTILTLNLLTTTIVSPPSNASKWQMGFNSAFKGLNTLIVELKIIS